MNLFQLQSKNNMDTDEEIWKQLVIDGNEYNYEVSNMGKIRVKSTQKVMSLNKCIRYLRCQLIYKSKRKMYYIHRLVAIIFIDNPNKLLVVNHVNHNSHDNRATNLEWVTYSENAIHSYQNYNRVLLGHVLLQYELGTNKLIKEYISKSEAARILNMSIHTVTRLAETRDEKYGYYLVYKDKPISKKQDNSDLSEFVEIQNYKNYYIHRDGRVYSKYTNKLLKPVKNIYLYVNIGNNKAIHRLVAQHFIPNPENKPHVNHKDGNKLNYHVDNLEWATRSENLQHAIDTGLNSCTISIKQYTLDGQFVSEYKSISDACRALNIPTHCVSMITRSCDKKVKYAYNFIWRYSNDNDITPVSNKEHKYRKIGQYTMDDILLQTFDSLSEAAIAIGKNKRHTGSLSACYSGKADSAHGYKWKPIVQDSFRSSQNGLGSS